MSTTSTYAAALKRILSDLTYYIDLSTYIFGTMGCIGNLIAFSSRQMRRSSAALYLISATVSQLVTILVCVGFRLFYDHSSSNLMNESIVFCKFRYYLAVALPALASYFMSLATFDRFLCASNNGELRAWCQPKIAKRFIMIMVLVGIIIPIHIPIQFNIYNNLCQTSPGSAYIFIYGGYLILVVIFLPHILMFVFSLITLMIMRKSRKRVIPELTVTGNNLPNHRRKLELKLIKIIVVQVFLSMLLSLLRFGSSTYRVIVFNIVAPTADQRAAEAFAETLGSSLYFFNYAISFYVSMLTSKFFRSTFYEQIRHYGRHLIRRIF